MWELFVSESNLAVREYAGAGAAATTCWVL